MPCDPAAPAGLQRFEECFLRGEPARITLRRGGTFRIAVIAFVRCVDALDEPRRSRHRFCDAINFNNVGADG